MVDRQKLLREKLLVKSLFIRDGLTGRNDTLTQIGQDYGNFYNFLVVNPDVDLFTLSTQERERIAPQHVWDVIYKMRRDIKLTGCEVVARYIQEHQPGSSRIQLGHLTSRIASKYIYDE